MTPCVSSPRVFLPAVELGGRLGKTVVLPGLPELMVAIRDPVGRGVFGYVRDLALGQLGDPEGLADSAKPCR